MLRHCHECGYSTTDSSNFNRHVKAKHKYSSDCKNSNNILSGNVVNNHAALNNTVNDEIFDIRLKENFKLLSLDLQDMERQYLCQNL